MAEGGDDELGLSYLSLKDDNLSVSLEEEQRKERRCKEFYGSNTSATQKDYGGEFWQQKRSYNGQSPAPNDLEQGSDTVEEEDFFISCKSLEKTCKETFNTGGIDGLNKLLETKLSQWKEVPVTFAVVGKPGSGKSSFINAVRDIETNDNEAAEVGHTETTFKISRYVHPKQRNITFWDLPGIGTTSFPQELYEETMNNFLKGMDNSVQNISEFDFFLILTADRFTEHDQWLVESISKRYQKKCYLVRTHVDVTCYKERRKKEKQKGPQKSDDEIKQEILKYMKENLQLIRCSDTQIFMIDNYDTEAHDFDKLRQCLFEDAPESKREALAFTLSGVSEQMIEKKRSLLFNRVKISSLICGNLPGFSTMALVNQIRFIKEQFGVTEEDLSKHTNLPYIFPLKSQVIKCTDEWVNDLYSSNYFMHVAGVTDWSDSKKLWIAALGGTVITRWWKSYQLLKRTINACADDAKKIQKAILKVKGTSSTV